MIGMTALLAGMGQGYLEGQRRQRDQDRQDELDRQRNADFAARQDERAFQKSERDREARLREGVAEAAAPATVGEEQLSGPTMPGDAPLPVAPKVNGKFYASMSDANAATEAYNNQDAQTERVAAVHMRMGDVAGARKVKSERKQEQLTDIQLRAAVEQARTEGTGQALADVLSGLPPEQVLQRFNAAGGVKLRNLRYEPFETTHPVLGKTKSARITGTTEDGKPFEVPDALAASFGLFKAEKRFGLLADAHKAEVDQKNSDRDFGLREKALAANIANQQAQLGFERQRIAMEGARLNLARAAAEAEAKIPPAVKTQFASYDKELNTIGSAIAQAQAKGEWNETSKGAQALMLRHQELMDKTEALLSPYIATTKAGKAAAGKPGDALGIFTDKPGTAPAPKAAPPAAGAASPGIGATMADLARRGMGAVTSAAGEAQAQGAQYQAIATRVREAASGGAPLTPQEVAAARRFAIAIPR